MQGKKRVAKMVLRLRDDQKMMQAELAKRGDRRAERLGKVKKRGRRLLDIEGEDLQKLRTENATSMDTSLNTFRKKRKLEKRGNARLGGNKTNKDVGRD